MQQSAVKIREQEDEPDAVDLAGLQAIVADLAHEASSLGVDLVDISGAIQDVAAVSARHQNVFTDVVKSAGDIAHATREVAVALSDTDQAAGRAREVLVQSSGELVRSIADIRSLASTTDMMSGEIGSFSNALTDVDRFAAEIAQIARQTNLLALNAAIESRRNPRALAADFANHRQHPGNAQRPEDPHPSAR